MQETDRAEPDFFFLMKFALLQVILTLKNHDWIHKNNIVVAIFISSNLT